MSAISSVRAVLVGDPEVGKSSIIKCYISNNFDDHVASVIPVAVLPPEASPEGVPLTLVDTSSKDPELLEDELRKADVAVIVYAADRPDTLARVGSHWLPRLRELTPDLPVVVVGNKLDLRSGDAQAIESELRNAALPLMGIFRQVETLMECSAKRSINISELMVLATKAVLHPTAPLYDTSVHELKPACVRALTRIFSLCDETHDGALDDKELNKFQVEVFGTPLVPTQISGIKNLLRRNVHDGLNDAGITLAGYMFLHKLFIQRGRSETTWQVLRAFSYTSALRLAPERLLPASSSSLAPDQIWQLTPASLAFLTSLFRKHTNDPDGLAALSPAQVRGIFADKTPGLLWEGRAWPQLCTRVDGNGSVDEHAFLSLWVASCHLDTLKCLEYLLYLGYSDGRLAAAASAVEVCPPRSADYKRRVTSRSVFEVLVCCAAGLDPAEVALGFVGREREAVQGGGGEKEDKKEKKEKKEGDNESPAPLVSARGQTHSIGSGSSVVVVGKAFPARAVGSLVHKSVHLGVHLIVRAVSLDEAHLILQGRRNLSDVCVGGVSRSGEEGGDRAAYEEGGGGGGGGKVRRARDCLDVVVLAYESSDSAAARSCFAVHKEMEDLKMRTPCLFAGVKHTPENAGASAEDKKKSPEVQWGVVGGNHAESGQESAADFCAKFGLHPPVACVPRTDGYARLYTTVADACLRPREFSPILLKEASSGKVQVAVYSLMVLGLMGSAAFIYLRRNGPMSIPTWTILSRNNR